MDIDRATPPESTERAWADIAVRLVLAAIIAYWSFLLLRPFIAVLVWAAILAVAMHPIQQWLKRVMGGHGTMAAFLLTALALLIVLGPVAALGTALVENLSAIATGIQQGTVTVPPPPSSLADWPLLGGELLSVWQSASQELDQTLKTLEPQLNEAARALLGVLGSVGIGVLQFTVSIIIAGFTYNRAAAMQTALKTFAARAAPDRGPGYVDLAGGTVRSVARGVVGISLIQSILFGVGALVANIPFAGVWTFAVLILAIVQIGPALVILPVIVFSWITMDTAAAAILTAYMIPVMLLDNVLKPIVMGRGLPVPVLVIFIGVIGGTFTHGLIGLFVGPIVLALGYQLGRAWIAMDSESPDARPAE